MDTESSDQNFNFIVPVWGSTFTDLFTKTCLPMLLTKGNLYSRQYTCNDRFTIVTTWVDSQRIKQSESYNALCKIINVNFILIDGYVDLSAPHHAMTYCYSVAMSQPYVRPNKTYFVFLTPDSFWTNGTFEYLYNAANHGKKVVMAMGLRTNAEDMARDITNLNPSLLNDRDIKNEDIIPLIFKNLHQMSKAHDCLSSTFLNSWPSHLYWIDYEKHQLIAHCFHLHPLLVLSPNKKTSIGTTIDAQYIDNLAYSIEDYEICQEDHFAIELSAKNRSWQQKLSYPTIRNIVKFSLLHTNKMHRYFFKHRIIIGIDKSINPGLSSIIQIYVDSVDKQWNYISSYLRIAKRRLGQIRNIALKYFKKLMFITP